MAKSVRLGSKQFFTMTVLTVSALGLILATSLSLQTTNSRSDASGCNTKPSLVLVDTSGTRVTVTYHLKLINNCSGDNNFSLKVIQTPTQPEAYKGWGWKFAQGDWYETVERTSVSGTTNVNLTVSRPGYANCKDCMAGINPGKYYWITVKAALSGNPDVYNTLNLTYDVEN